jgi:hypothetical protein
VSTLPVNVLPPRSRWPDSSLLLCGARPAVAAALTRPGLPRSVPVYDTVDQALAQARSRPPFLRERLGLVTTLDAFTTAGWFVGQVCRRWQLGELAETARWLAGELAIDAVFAQRSNLEASSCGWSCAQVGCSSPSTAALPTRP